MIKLKCYRIKKIRWITFYLFIIMRRFYRIALRCSCFLIFTIPLLLYYRIIKSIPSQPEIGLYKFIYISLFYLNCAAVKSHSELLQYYPTFPNLESQLHLNTFDQTDCEFFLVTYIRMKRLVFYPDDCLKGDPCAVIRPHFIIIGKSVHSLLNNQY